METWLKTLIAAACVVVIAVGGYYLFDQIQRQKRATALSAGRDRAEQELFDLAKAGANESEKVRQMCRGLSGHDDSEFVRHVRRNCVSLGYL